MFADARLAIKLRVWYQNSFVFSFDANFYFREIYNFLLSSEKGKAEAFLIV